MFPRLFRLHRRARRSRLTAMFTLLFTVVAFISPFYIIYKPPHVLIRYFQARWPDVLWHVPVRAKVIALTIDDAPSGHTREIADVLRENGARATFFVIGAQVEAGGKGELEELVRRGNELGNHAMHDEPSRSLSHEQLSEQLLQVEGMINATYAAVGVDRPPNRFFRPGSGFFSDKMRAQVREMGYRVVLGSIYPHDPQIAYAGVNARHILSMARPGGIIICHDRRSWTVPMLRVVVPELKRRGYVITTVTGLLEAGRREMGD